MKTMKISFFFTDIGCEKEKILIFHVFFFNKDISITVADIILKFCISVLHILPERSVSKIFLSGPSFYFMWFRKKYFENIHKVTRFLR